MVVARSIAGTAATAKDSRIVPLDAVQEPRARNSSNSPADVAVNRGSDANMLILSIVRGTFWTRRLCRYYLLPGLFD
jgi:hypothetical protein